MQTMLTTLMSGHHRALLHSFATLSLAGLSACSGGAKESPASAETAPARIAGATLVVHDSLVTATQEISGVAEPAREAMLSTKLMGTVTAVLVQEGDVVQSGQVLLRIDARELRAKASQVSASIEDASVQQREASTQAARIRALYADSAATRAQFDAAETGLARAEAGLRAARAAASELDAVSSYATVRAPFAGIVTARMVDPGAFAAPGTPLLTVQDASVLRVKVSAAGDAVRTLRRGQPLTATLDGVSAPAVIEGVVPSGQGNLFTVNATIANRGGTLRAGTAATLSLPTGMVTLLLVPVGAIVRDGDLTGVVVHGVQRDERRWVRLGATRGTLVEVTSGLSSGETIVVPQPARTAAGA